MVAYSEILLFKCAQFRDESEFIDVRLKVGEDVFPAHRIVLAANSDYFYAMFIDGMKESKQEVIELKDESISPDALKIVMDSMYTGNLRINEENVFEVLAAADHLQVTSVVQQCCDFLKREFIQRPDLHNYCLLFTVANRHGLRDLQEAVEHEMASMYEEVCESEEFLMNIGADELFSLLGRDDLIAPSETFVFKSVMQWIKYKKEERMAVAAKIIGAVRLGLVDIRIVNEELNIEEMQRVPEINLHLQESLRHYEPGPCDTFKLAVEKTRPRLMLPVLVAIQPTAAESLQPKAERFARVSTRKYTHGIQYFDVKTKKWKRWRSVPELGKEIRPCFSAEMVGNYLYVAAQWKCGNLVYRYNIDDTGVFASWETLPHLVCPTLKINCLCSVDDFIYVIRNSMFVDRCSLEKKHWQSGDALDLNRSDGRAKFCTVEAVGFKSKVFVIHGYKRNERNFGPPKWVNKPAVVHCFDPENNEWEQKASTCHPHFGSSLFVVNKKLCLAGGNTSCDDSGDPCGYPAPVEVYNEENNTWSVLRQKRIPRNNLGAVDIEGRVYFIINKFPVDSGIRIPPGERYQISLKEWENLAKVSSGAVLCYLPVKRENLKAGEGESKIKN